MAPFRIVIVASSEKQVLIKNFASMDVGFWTKYMTKYILTFFSGPFIWAMKHYSQIIKNQKLFFQCALFNIRRDKL